MIQIHQPKLLDEFKKFIARGNVIDLAVGVIIGAAFTAIVNSLVTDIIMPPIGWLTGKVDFSDKFFALSGGQFPTLDAAKKAGAVTINYGLFINAVIRFMIVAFVVFLLVRQVNKLKQKHEDAAAAAAAQAAAAPSKSEELLTEIRDLLKAPRTP